MSFDMSVQLFYLQNCWTDFFNEALGLQLN
jgi:hypothetical protein